MGSLAVGVAHLQFVGLDQCRTVHAVPISHSFIVLRGLVFTAVFELNDRALAEGEQVSQQKTVGRFNSVLVIFRLLVVARAGRVPGKRKSHVSAAPVIAAAAPFLSAGAVGLRRLAVVKKEAR